MKEHIKTNFLRPKKLENVLIFVKDHLDPLQHKGIYKIIRECGTCYIGETSRSILERVKEHCADLQYNKIIKSALAKHVDKTKHHILMDKVEVLARCDKLQERRIREAIEIKLNPNNINRDQGNSHNFYILIRFFIFFTLLERYFYVKSKYINLFGIL